MKNQVQHVTPIPFFPTNCLDMDWQLQLVERLFRKFAVHSYKRHFTHLRNPEFSYTSQAFGVRYAIFS